MVTTRFEAAPGESYTLTAAQFGGLRPDEYPVDYTMTWTFASKMDCYEPNNDHPDANYGKRYGFVREGDKWYPAIQVSKERDEGWLGSNKTQVNFQYGTEIKWKKGKAGQGWVPYFEPGQYRSKNFHVWDSAHVYRRGEEGDSGGAG